MASFQVEERTRLRRQWVDQSIALAMQNRWEDAARVNRQILELFPNDVDASNRLGRALTELGRYREAREAYKRAVELDPTNSIAHKNLHRLSVLKVEQAPPPTPERIDPRLFIAETGKTGVASLVRTAAADVLARMSLGDQVYFHPEGRALIVRNARGEYLGQVEPKLSQRLIDLMRGGNRYAAALMTVTNTAVRIIIRETYQDPSQTGKVSFPVRGETPGVRPYTRETLLRYEEEEDEEAGEEEEELGIEPELEEAEEPAEMTEFEEEAEAE
ncbi:MAG: tetratricopeptide repeat protein [Chloroflexi bacterium]|nr:tetratricopeptide repeat protein [Chloroflexota bacterium]